MNSKTSVTFSIDNELLSIQFTTVNIKTLNIETFSLHITFGVHKTFSITYIGNLMYTNRASHLLDYLQA